MSEGEWNPSMVAADVHQEGRFSFALCQLEYDDPFTAIISYDVRFSQPWSRTDVRREIVDLVYFDGTVSGDFIPVCLSNEGDVYFLSGHGTHSTKITGMGLLSADADGRGVMAALCFKNKKLIAIGENQTIFELREDGDFDLVNFADEGETLQEGEHFTHIASRSAGDLIISGYVPAKRAISNLAEDPRFRPDMQAHEVIKLIHQVRSESLVADPSSSLFNISDHNLVRLCSLGSKKITSLYVDNKKNIFFGAGCMLYEYHYEQKHYNIIGSFESDVLSITRFNDNLILATDHNLFIEIGKRFKKLKPIIPKISKIKNIAPFKLMGISDKLFYFDHIHGVCVWDGRTWQWMDIPAELLDRIFHGI